LFAQVFCDFGESFTVVDTNGEPTVSAMIADISNDKEGMSVIHLIMCRTITKYLTINNCNSVVNSIQSLTSCRYCKSADKI
jgi:hypothetical protein